MLPKTRGQAKEEGSRIYFTGKDCKRGHSQSRWTSSGGCMECVKDRRDKEKGEYLAELDDISIYIRRKKKENDEWLEFQKSYREKYPEKAAAIEALYNKNS